MGTTKIATKPLLIEIGTEELPPAQLPTLENSFKEIFANELNNHNVSFSEIKSYATPRRLALKVTDLAVKQPDAESNRRGPALAAAFAENGEPTPAGLGFAKSCGVDIKELEQVETANGTFLNFTKTVPGKLVKDLLPELLKLALHKLPIAKHMRWGDLSESFVRPVHWILLLLGKDLIPTKLFNIEADKFSRGHRFHSPKPLAIKSIDSYEETLEKTGWVIADSEKRKSFIKTEVEQEAERLGGNAVIDPALLDIVNGLVEYPVILSGDFAEEFLTLPKEALISALQEHQKCFAVADKQDKLLPKFIVVSNIKSTSPATVVNGNTKVVQARLADGMFHYQHDQQFKLADKLEALKSVVFQHNLGTMHAKTLRIQEIASYIAKKIGAQSKAVEQAAALSKSDLLTNMVGEFPELQGTIGYYYALNDGENQETALAIKEQYLPRYAADTLPQSLPGICLALADRIDTLVGNFSIGKFPTAEKDPFSLRRQTLAILRILIEKSLSLDLKELFALAYQNYAQMPVAQEKFFLSEEALLEKLMHFSFDRLRSYCLDKKIPAKIFAAVLAKQPSNPFNFYCRLKAVQSFSTLAEAQSLAEANKRVHNILVKAKEQEINIMELAKTGQQVDLSLFSETAEHELWEALSAKEQEVIPLLEQTDFTAILQTLTTLKPTIDTFFDQVMVMVTDSKVKQNRLLLLYKLRLLFLKVADISLL